MDKKRSITLTLLELATLSSFLNDKEQELSKLEETAGQHEALNRLKRTIETTKEKIAEALRDIEAELTQTDPIQQD